MIQNLSAFLRVIRAGETSQDEQAYRWLFGSTPRAPKLFDSFADHPRIKTWEKNDEFIRNGKKDYTTAAGAYQIVESTWDPLAKRLGLPDFSPASQDRAAVALIEGRKALADVEAGRIEQAIAKCAKEWASLPGSPYGQPTKTMAQALAIYRQYGGLLEGEAAAAPTPDESSPYPGHVPPRPMPSPAPPEWRAPAGEADITPPQEPEMTPLLLALGSSLIDIFTPLAKEKITKEVARHTDNPAVAAQIATAAIDTAKAVTGLADPIEAVAAAKKDPAVMVKVEASALDQLAKLAPLLDKMHAQDKEAWAAEEASRDAAAKRAATDPWDMSQALVTGAFAIIGSLILFVCVIAGIQAYKGDIKAEVWAQIAGLIGFATGVGTTLYAYRFGTSRSSSAKDVVIGELSKRGK